MDLADLLLLAVQPEVGHGSHTLVEVELIFVVFIVGLLCGVLGMTAFFIWFHCRQQRRDQFPAETERLLAEWNDEALPEPPPKSVWENRTRPDDPGPRDAWEKDPEWWRKT